MLDKTGYFEFAGRSSRFYNLVLTSANDVEGSANRQVGLSRSYNVSNMEDERVDLELTFAFIKSNGEIVNENDVLEVTEWLFRYDEPKAFTVRNSRGNYYLIFTECTYNANGYFICTASSEPYCYTDIMVTNTTVTLDRQVDYNCEDIKGESYPLIILSAIDKDNTITLRTLSGEVSEMTIQLLKDELVEIDCDTREISSNKDNIYSRVTFNNYPRLYSGKNVIQYSLSDKSSRVNVSVQIQDRLALGLRNI